MITIRPAHARGHADHGWLSTYHSFSFADYYDPAYSGFRDLRVLNEDVVQPGRGFGTHPHRNMEILTWILAGALEHRDSLGQGSVLRAGDVQRMTAGSGVTHSELNPSATDVVHFLQIWVVPDTPDLTPEYEQRPFPEEERVGRLQLIASPSGRDASLTIHQAVEVFATVLRAGQEVVHVLAPERYAWVQVTSGELMLNGKHLRDGDGASVGRESRLVLRGVQPAQCLLFDLK